MRATLTYTHRHTDFDSAANTKNATANTDTPATGPQTGRMINCQNMLSKAKCKKRKRRWEGEIWRWSQGAGGRAGRAGRAGKAGKASQQHNKKCGSVRATMCAPMYAYVFILTCHYVTTDSKIYYHLDRRLPPASCLLPPTTTHRTLSGAKSLESPVNTHSNLLSKLNLRLADQFDNMNHMERFAL